MILKLSIPGPWLLITLTNPIYNPLIIFTKVTPKLRRSLQEIFGDARNRLVNAHQALNNITYLWDNIPWYEYNEGLDEFQVMFEIEERKAYILSTIHFKMDIIAHIENIENIENNDDARQYMSNERCIDGVPKLIFDKNIVRTDITDYYFSIRYERAYSGTNFTCNIDYGDLIKALERAENS